MVQVYRELHIDTARLLAWSFGGGVATNFAMHHPDMVKKLALLAPFKPFVRQGLGFWVGFVPFISPTRRAARFFERRMCAKGDFGHREHSDLLFERYRGGKLVIKVPTRTYTDLEFKLLTMPTLLLVGDEEFLYDGPASVQRARAILPNGDAEIIPDCNHAVVSDQTDYVRDRILGFLDETHAATL